MLSTYDVCKMRLATGLCSRGAQVLVATNFCPWVAQNTFLFQISLIVLGTQYFIVRSLGVLIKFFLGHSLFLTFGIIWPGIFLLARACIHVQFNSELTGVKCKGLYFPWGPCVYFPEVKIDLQVL